MGSTLNAPPLGPSECLENELLDLMRASVVRTRISVFSHNQPTAGQAALIQSWACSAISKVR